MLVYKDSTISGTIGGGAIEGDVIDKALALFDTNSCKIISYDLRKDGRSKDLDLICGGHMEVLLEYIDTVRENESLYSSVCQKIERDEPFLLKAVIVKEDAGIAIKRSIEDLPAPGITQGQNSVTLHTANEERILIEPVLPGQTVYLIGGGHVSKEIAQLTKQIGFRTLVFDDRNSFANRSRFPQADEIHVCPEYVDVFKPFQITSNSYIVIITRGHSYDKEVLAQALQTGAGYIGMMGSRKKRDTIYDTLIGEGFTVEKLKEVHCPIGLPIKAETPAELAVSIVGELINHRGRQKVDEK